MQRQQTPVQIGWCWEGVYYTVVLGFILAGAVFRDFNLLIILAGMMFGPLVISLLMVGASLRRLAVRRHLPEGVGAGETFDVRLEVRNERRWLSSWGLRVTDTGLGETGARLVVSQRTLASERAASLADGARATASPAVLFPLILPGRTAGATYSAMLARRGRYVLGPLMLSTRMPFGLWRARTRVACQDELLVYPRLGRLAFGWRKRLSQRELEGRQATTRQGLADGDYYGLRDWRSGDSRRWIHWRTSARRNQLMVRQFERQTNRDLCLLLDLHGDPADTAWARRMELAISFVASVCADLCRAGGSHLSIGTSGSSVCWLTGPASSGLQREVMHWMALIDGHRNDGLPALLERASDEYRPGDTLILVTPGSCDDHRLSAASSEAPSLRWQRLVAQLQVLPVAGSQFDELFVTRKPQQGPETPSEAWLDHEPDHEPDELAGEVVG